MRAARRATALVAAATFAGILLVSVLRSTVAYTLPLSAGVTIYVAASDLIPEVNREGARNSLTFFVGVVLYFAVHLLLPAGLD